MWRLMSQYVRIYSTILNYFDANFQIYSIKLVITPSRDIWTWTHHHPSVELDFAVDQHENSLHDCLTVAPQHKGTEDLRSHRTGEDEEARAVRLLQKWNFMRETVLYRLYPFSGRVKTVAFSWKNACWFC